MRISAAHVHHKTDRGSFHILGKTTRWSGWSDDRRRFLYEDGQEGIHSREEERRRRGNGRHKKWTKNQEMIVLAGVVAAIGIAVAVYENQLGAQFVA